MPLEFAPIESAFMETLQQPALYDWMTVLWVSLIPLALALAALAASVAGARRPG
ncbi:hypothetical protein [Achromobacter xylosoxidans]|uniref:hypothetical protein n=1 Tax=Alcaligenes xylosoxydans xylosoxydans TaxID=85698 RepID=UPI001EEAE55B|nr:hypothetical protein [Achromobacter xylosoxidans]